MRILLVVTLWTLFVLCESKKLDVDNTNADYKHLKTDSKDVTFSKYDHQHKKHRLRGKHLDLQEGGTRSLHDDWKKIPKGNDCMKTKCGHKEFCLANPKTGEEKCISKRNYKESRRLFRSFHKKKEFLKKDIPSDLLDKDLTKGEHMKEVYDLLNDYTKMEKHHHDKTEKKLDVKTLMAKNELQTPTEAKTGTAEECRPMELYELKKRMVGWFVLMHTESRRSHHRGRPQTHHKKHGPSKHHHHDSGLNKKHDHLDVHKKKDFGLDKKHGHHLDIDMKKDFGLDKKHGHHLDIDMKKTDFKKHHLSKRATATDTVESESHHQCKCSKSAMWEFHKQDTNRDKILSRNEMEAFSANRREPCMAALLKSCDTDSDSAITHGEWCCCMAYTIPPCFEKKRLTDPKVWIPRCDKEGFYERTQCHADTGYCWCVDLNGNEIVGTKTLGDAHCGKYGPNGHLEKP